ncbi:MAG: TIGR01212 family radical SAM protein [Deltaproteobacteria bacterium]|nr:TIGR01212 family radical SAM protein [Deltaproteobacteria bacterium]
MSRPHDEPHRFTRLSTVLRQTYGERVYKIGLRGGFTCPNRDGRLATGGCVFCASEALEAMSFRPGHTIDEQLIRGMEYVKARHGARRFVAYYQDYTATYAPAQRLEAIYGPALRHKDVVALALGTRPDCLDVDALVLLERVAAKKDVWVELGLQLADDALLAAMGRGHDVSCFERGVHALQERGLAVCAHVIIGYPGATKEMERRTADLLRNLGVWGVKLHAFHVLKGTPLAEPYSAGELPVLSCKEHVERVALFLEALPPTMVIHRVTAEAARDLTLGPAWTINKMQAFDAVLDGLVARDSWQGKALGAEAPSSLCGCRSPRAPRGRCAP